MWIVGRKNSHWSNMKCSGQSSGFNTKATYGEKIRKVRWYFANRSYSNAKKQQKLWNAFERKSSERFALYLL
jgi:hypothetical protein